MFSISGRGTVATGRVERGICNKGDEVEIIGLGSKLKTTLTGIGMLAPSEFVQFLIMIYQKCSTRNWIGYATLIFSFVSILSGI